MINLNHQLDLIRQSPTVAMADRVNSLKAQGEKIIGLQTGDPDFPTHPGIQNVAMKALRGGWTHYGPSRGFLDVRQAVAAKLDRDNGVTYDPESEILMTHGGIHAYYIAMQSLINPGDDVLIPDPSYATHVNMAIMLRANAIRVPSLPENGFLPSIDAWERALTPNTRVMVINYPSNPTGVYPSYDYLKMLQDFASANHLWVVSDEVYENLYYEHHPICASKFFGAKDRTILIHSLSKTYAMTGWRVGYLAATVSVIENALKAGQNSITCVAPFIQKAAAFALGDPEIQQYAALMRENYLRRRDRILQVSTEYQSSKVAITPPMGAFYFFLDMRALKMSSIEICERILNDAKVGLVPGAAFGQHGEGFVRMTTAASDDEVEAGFRKIIEWAETH